MTPRKIDADLWAEIAEVMPFNEAAAMTPRKMKWTGFKPVCVSIPLQ